MGPGGEAIRQLRTWSWGRRYLPSIRLASARTATKEEDIREIAGPSVRDAAWNEQKERREDNVHGEIKGKEGRKELRPSERNGEAIGITQIDARNALLLEFEETRAAFSPGVRTMGRRRSGRCRLRRSGCCRSMLHFPFICRSSSFSAEGIAEPQSKIK